MAKLPEVRLFNFYGQTEMSPMATLMRPEDQLRKAGSAGMPAINVETRVVDDRERPLPAGEVGEIVHRWPHAMLGYSNDPDKTAEVFRNGWFHSGDIGVIDEEGYLSIVDRKKDMIETGGEKRRQPRGRGNPSTRIVPVVGDSASPARAGSRPSRPPSSRATASS